MKDSVRKAIKPGDAVVYKEGYPPWWDPEWINKIRSWPMPAQIKIEYGYCCHEVLTSARSSLQEALWKKTLEES